MTTIRRITSAAAAMGIAGALLLPVAASAAPEAGPRSAPGAVLLEHGVTISENDFAPRTTEYVEGGEWRYGTRSAGVLRKEIYSDYWHKTKKHGSSVKTGGGILRRSADTAKNSWSRVAFNGSANGIKAYYRIVS